MSMFIEQSPRGYDRNGQQVVRRARFLILVQRGVERVEHTCERCSGFGRYVSYEPDLDPDHVPHVVPCAYCTPIKCDSCSGKGYLYIEGIDEHARTCEKCKGKGDLGGSGKAFRYVHHKEIRALVRKVAMHQCGHFMMGSARVLGKRIGLSGCYGGDGLPTTVPRDVFDVAIPIPDELHEAWNKGGGWNGAGSEAYAMRDWALANLDKLETRKGRKR